MLTSKLLRDALLSTTLRSSEPPVYLRSGKYMAVGCDLKDLQTLERVLRSEFDACKTCFLFVAEVSVTYMPVNDADALIRWASTLDNGTIDLNTTFLSEFANQRQPASAFWNSIYLRAQSILSHRQCYPISTSCRLRSRRSSYTCPCRSNRAAFLTPVGRRC